MSGFGDPFNFSGMQEQPGDFWRNLALFGAGLSTGANARTPSGHLAYGTGFAGPLGAAVQSTAQANLDIAKNRAATGYTQAQTQGQLIQNQIAKLGIPSAELKAKLFQYYAEHPEALNGANVPQLDMGGGPQAATGGATPQAPANFTGGGQTLANAPDVSPIVQAAAQKNGVPLPLAMAYLQQESGLGTNPAAKGNIGQITFNTAVRPGYGMQPLTGAADIADPNKNINFSMEYLRKAGDAAGVKDWNDPAQWPLALKAYNGGGDPNYVANVARWLPKGVQMAGAAPPASQVAGAPATPQLYQVAQAGNGPIPGPPTQLAPQATQASPGGMPAPAPVAMPQGQAPQMAPPAPVGPNMQAMRQAQLYEDAANRIELQKSLGLPVAGDPAALRQAAQQYRSLALAGPMAGAAEAGKLPYAGPQAAATANAQLPAKLAAIGFQYGPNGLMPIPGGMADPAYVGAKAAAEAAAKLPYELREVRPGGALFQGGKPIGSVPLRSDEVVQSGPNAGMHVQLFRDPLSGAPVGGEGAAAPGEGIPSGAIPTKLSPQQEGRLNVQGKLEGEDINHDRKIVEEDLSHIIENVAPAKQQLFQLRGLIDQAAPGAAGQFRAEFKNWVQTFAPDFVSQITGRADPAQEFNKIALMGAGKQERGDLGARGGFRAIEMYVKANPNLDMQPTANRDMANALLVSHQFHEDYANGASEFYQKNRAGFLNPDKPEAYTPVSVYDRKFVQMMRPELYAAAIGAINGKPYADWSKNLTVKQLQIVGGILQRTDPGAVVDLGGKRVPVTAFTQVMGPTDIMGASSAR